MAPHSSIHVWRIPWTEEPGRLQFMGSQSQAHQEEEIDRLFRIPVKFLLFLFQDCCLIILLIISISLIGYIIIVIPPIPINRVFQSWFHQ